MLKSNKTTWLFAASTSAVTLVFIAAKVLDVIPGATFIDVAALAITGILTGLFLGLSLTTRVRSLPTAE